MNNQNTIFTTILLVLGCVALSPVTQARQLSEDRGNGNSAAENVQALNLGTTGANNTAHGWFSLFSDTTGLSNTADGFQALDNNTTRDSNTAVGSQALLINTTGTNNTALGAAALSNNVNGANNTAIGIAALAGATGSGNVGLGDSAGGFVTTANHVICIGSFGENVSDSCYIANIAFQASEGVPVLIDATDKLGTTISTGRFKDDIRPMAEASEALFTFKPVTFRYKKEIDPKGKSQFGLV